MMKKIIVTLLSAVLFLSACGSNEQKEDKKNVTIGITSNDSVAWKKVQELAKEEGINVELKAFSDYNVPNTALNDGDIDMNAFQHFAFLNEFEKAHEGVEIKPIRTTVLAPLGIYSEKIEDIKDVKDGAKVIIPNDVSNQARALKLLEKVGLLKLNEDFGLTGSPKDIKENKKNLEIKAVDAQQTARALSDVDLSIINNGVAVKAGLNPKDDPIFLEDSEGEATKPYINFIAVKESEKDNEVYNKVADLYHSKEAQDALKEDTKDGEIIVDLDEDEIEAIEKELAK